MRSLFLCISAACAFSGLATGTDPVGCRRARAPSDYPVRQTTNTATIAAAIVPPNQARKMFSAEIARQYIIVEVAVYPQISNAVDLKPLLFTLKVGGRIGGAAQPTDVAAWPNNSSPPGRSTGVTAEAGVAYAGTIGPRNGRSSQTPSPTPSNSGPDPRIVADRIWNKVLPDGQIAQPVAGYLYFPQYAKKRKSDPLELKYSTNDLSAMLLFPK